MYKFRLGLARFIQGGATALIICLVALPLIVLYGIWPILSQIGSSLSHLTPTVNNGWQAAVVAFFIFVALTAFLGKK